MDFFNGIGRKFTHVARSVQEITRESVENTRLNGDLRSAREELERRYAELGRAFYAAQESGGEVPARLTEDVRMALEQLESILAQRDRRIRCPGCGAAQAEEARFCSNCGKRMPEEAPELSGPDDDAEYCGRCGAMRCGEGAYCPLCGAAYEPQPTTPDGLSIVQTARPEPLEEPDPAECAE